MARSDDKDESPIPIRLSKALRRALVRAASREGQGLAAWIRSKIFPHLERFLDPAELKKSGAATSK